MSRTLELELENGRLRSEMAFLEGYLNASVRDNNPCVVSECEYLLGRVRKALNPEKNSEKTVDSAPSL